MTAHDHTTFVPGCYRCDLNLDEVGIDRTDLKRHADEQAAGNDRGAEPYVTADRIETAEARKAARRRYVDGPRDTARLLTLNHERISAFIAGAAWQASRPDVPTAGEHAEALVNNLAMRARGMADDTDGPIPAKHWRFFADWLDGLVETDVPAAGLRVTREAVAALRVAGFSPIVVEEILAALGVTVVDGNPTRETEAAHAALCDGEASDRG